MYILIHYFHIDNTLSIKNFYLSELTLHIIYIYIYLKYTIHKPVLIHRSITTRSTDLPAHQRLIKDLKAIRQDMESSYTELVNTQTKFVENPPTVRGSQPSVT